MNLKNKTFRHLCMCVDAMGSSVYDNKESLGLEHGKIRQTKGGGGNIGITVHEEHEYMEPPPEALMGFSTDGCYDNPGKLLGNTLHQESSCHPIITYTP